MGAFVKGDVVVIAFPYSDFSQTKKRPALVLAVPREDEVILCQITGRNTRPEHTISLSDDDFADGGLQKLSYVRPDHLFTVESTVIKYKAGRIKEEKLSSIIEASVEILREL